MSRLHLVLTIGSLACLVACGDDPAPEAPPDAGAAAQVEEPLPDPRLEQGAAANAPPRIELVRFEPDEPAVGDTVRAVAETSDEDGDTVWLSYAWTVDGEPIGGDDEELALEGAPFARGSTLEVSVVASDGKDEDRDSESAELVNAVPRLLSLEVLPEGELVSGVPITLRPDARDADGDDLEFRYEWRVNGRTVREDGPVLQTERLRRGDTVQAWVVVADEDDESEPTETPLLTIANSPPRVVSRPGEPSRDGVFRYQVEASDPDGDRNLQFHLEGAPPGMTIDHLRGAVVWAPGSDQAGHYQVAVIVDDLRGGKTRHVFEVDVAPPPGAPPASPAQ